MVVKMVRRRFSSLSGILRSRFESVQVYPNYLGGLGSGLVSAKHFLADGDLLSLMKLPWSLRDK